MHQTGRRTAIAVATTVAALVASLALTATPASAHTLDSAVRAAAGCGWSSGSYSISDLDVLELQDGRQWGIVYLLWHGGRGENCVVTNRIGSMHGVATRTRATLDLQNRPNVVDDEIYAHFAAAVAPARGVCVRFSGAIYLVNTVATGGRTNYDNCG